MKIFVIIAAIVGISNASTSELFHGVTRTTIKGPSGTIVQETPGAHILKSLLLNKVYAPAFSAEVAVPESVIVEKTPIVPTPFYGKHLIHRVIPEQVFAAPVVPLPAPVVPEPYLPHSLAYSFAFPGAAPFSTLPVPFSPFLESRLAPVPALVGPTLPLPAPAPVFETRLFPEIPLYAERFVHSAPLVPAPVPVAPIGVYPVEKIPEVVSGKYPPAVPIPSTEYGL